MRVGQTELNIKDSIESNSQKQEQKVWNGTDQKYEFHDYFQHKHITLQEKFDKIERYQEVISYKELFNKRVKKRYFCYNTIYTIKTNPIIESFQENKPEDKLILLEEPEISQLQMLDVSIREPDINQFSMKILNIPDNILSPQYQEIKSFSSQSRLQYPQRNQSAFTPTGYQTKKINQLLLPKSKHRKILRRPQTSVQLVEESSSSRSQQSMLQLNNQSKENDLQFPSVTQSVSLSFQPPLNSFHIKNIVNASTSEQNIFNSGHNLLDTQMNLIGNQLFDTDAIRMLEITPEQEEELSCKIINVYKKCDYFTVSSLWKKTRDVKIQNFDVEYFWNQNKFEKQIFKSIYNNPFQQNEILLIGILKIDKQYFIVSVSQILKQNIELFNQQVLKMKDLVKIQITFELIFPFDNVWKDSTTLTFKEFIKWFVSDFELSLYVQQFGLSKFQKISVLQYLSQFAHIKDSKLKFEYYEERKKEIQLKKIQRRTLEIQRMESIENLFLRDKINMNQSSIFENSIIHFNFRIIKLILRIIKGQRNQKLKLIEKRQQIQGFLIINRSQQIGSNYINSKIYRIRL